MAPPPLRLLAQDAEDLKVLSAALQDAVTRIGDIRWEPKARRLTVAFNRFRWETPEDAIGERVRSALQFGSVTDVKQRRLRNGAKDAVLELLALEFEPAAEPPSGAVVMRFAGGGDLRAEMECLDAALADVSTPWPTPRRPRHDLTSGR